MIIPLLVTGSAIITLLAVFPYLLYPLSLAFLPKLPVRRRACTPPSATLVFCAYNEEASVPAKIANLRAIRKVWPAMQFRCFVDHSSDRTLELLQAHSDLLTVHAATERVGKASGMALMAAAAETDIMIFTDANVLLDPRCVPRLLSYFSDPSIGGVCGTLYYTNPDASDAARTSSTYWRLEEKIKALEARTGSTMGADGSIFATRRELYPVVPPHLLDDFLVSMAVILRGLRLISAPDVRAYETAATTSSDEFRRRRRIACRAYLSHQFMLPDIVTMRAGDIYRYVGHKLVRWYSFWLFTAAATLATAAATAAFGGRALLAIAGLLSAALIAAWLRKPAAARLVWEIFSQFLASGLGMVDAWRGRTYRIWTPQQRTTATLPLVPARLGPGSAQD